MGVECLEELAVGLLREDFRILRSSAMSSENEDIVLVPQAEDSNGRTLKKTKISYSREFLLSLSGLEECKKLPSGFDASILSEFEDSSSSHGIQDRHRVPGSSPLQGFRWSEYGSSPPTRGDGGNFSRESHRWDTRSSGRSDTDSQSDKDSDSGRRYGNQSRRPWQSSEHDGLLGSGSFPRTSGFGAGAAAPRPRPDDHEQQKKVVEPYHPPRPYKATPHTRRDKDSFNDETFGSTEHTSQDRAEEEKKRRAEFESMRKEQQKVLQENLKLSSGRPKVDPFDSLLYELGCDKTTDKVVEPPGKTSAQHESGKPSASSAPPVRPLVPPGFASSVVEKNAFAKSSNPSNSIEAGNFEPENGYQPEKEPTSGTGLMKFHSENSGHSSYKGGSTDEIMQLDTERTIAQKIVTESSQSTSLLEKLFGSALTVDDAPALKLVEDQDAKTRSIVSPHGFESSKFAQWFLEEGKKPNEKVSTEKSNGLLSLIVGEKDGSMIIDSKATQNPNHELLLGRVESNIWPDESVAVSEHLNNKKIEVATMVLTCEDLEQSMLSGMNESNSDSLPCSHYVSRVEVDQPNVDNNASQHLLSLLQKGTGSNVSAPTAIVEPGPFTHFDDVEPHVADVTHGNANDGSTDKLNSSGKTLTLETLFGSAFMQELQSVGAPVSSQRNSDGSARAYDSSALSFPVSDDAHHAPAIEGVGPKAGGISNSVDNRQPNINPDIGGRYFGFDDSRSGSGLPRLGSNPVAYDGLLEPRLPEEDSLIAISDPVNAHGSMFAPSKDVLNTELFSLNQPVHVAEKLAALGVAFKDEQSVVRGRGGMPFIGGPFDMLKPDFAFENLHAQSPPMHFQPQQINHRRPPFHPLDPHLTHIDPQLNYLPPEMMIHHDGRTLHQFPPNMVRPPFQNPGPALPEFDPSIHHPLLRQMHMNRKLPHAPHALGGFTGGGPMPLHPSNIPSGFPQEHNPMQGFPFGQQRPDFGGQLAPSGPELGGLSNPSEGLQRLLEMELRSNQKQVMHPFPPSSHPRPTHGDELDPGF
ncbi:hypothetical protein AKJ16_DCAP11002 [Drosera capensis]